MKKISSLVANYDPAVGGFSEGKFRNNPGNDTGSAAVAEIVNELYYASESIVKKYLGSVTDIEESESNHDVLDAIEELSSIIGEQIHQEGYDYPAGSNVFYNNLYYRANRNIDVLSDGNTFALQLAAGAWTRKDSVLKAQVDALSDPSTVFGAMTSRLDKNSNNPPTLLTGSIYANGQSNFISSDQATTWAANNYGSGYLRPNRLMSLIFDGTNIKNNISVGDAYGTGIAIEAIEASGIKVAGHSFVSGNLIHITNATGLPDGVYVVDSTTTNNFTLEDVVLTPVASSGLIQQYYWPDANLVDSFSYKYSPNNLQFSTSDQTYNSKILPTYRVVGYAAFVYSGDTYAGKVGVSGTTDGVGVLARFSVIQDFARIGTDLYACDTANHAIRKIDLLTSTVSTYAGSAGVSGNAVGSLAATRFNLPYGIETDDINLFICDSQNHCIKKIDVASGTSSYFAGSTTGVSGLVDATGTSARFNLPIAIKFYLSNFYISETGNDTIRKMDTGAVVITMAGTGTSGYFDNPTGTLAQFANPSGLCGFGNDLYIVDQTNNRIRKVSLTAPYPVTTYAGDGTASDVDGRGISAKINNPYRIYCDGINFYIGTNGNHLRIIFPGNGDYVKSIYGDGTANTVSGISTESSSITSPIGIIEYNGSLYVGGANNVIVKINKNQAYYIKTFGNGRNRNDGYFVSKLETNPMLLASNYNTVRHSVLASDWTHMRGKDFSISNNATDGFVINISNHGSISINWNIHFITSSNGLEEYAWFLNGIQITAGLRTNYEVSTSLSGSMSNFKLKELNVSNGDRIELRRVLTQGTVNGRFSFGMSIIFKNN